MRPEQISDALSYLDNDVIQETEQVRNQARKRRQALESEQTRPPIQSERILSERLQNERIQSEKQKNRPKRNPLNFLGMMAACVCLLIVGNIFFTHFLENPVEIPQTTESGENTDPTQEPAADPTDRESSPTDESPAPAGTDSDEASTGEQNTAEQTTGEARELPILSLTGEIGYMGSGSGLFVHDDVMRIVAESPWTVGETPETLPVFQNLLYTEDFVPYGFSKEDMTEKMAQIVEALGVEMPETLYTEAETYTSAYMTAETSIASIRMDGKGYITIRFDRYELPEEYRLTVDRSEDEAQKTMDYLIGQFSELLGFDQPETALVTKYDYDYFGQQKPRYIVYDGAGSLADELVNRAYNYAQFQFTEDGDLATIILENGLSCAEKLEDYPIISVEEARELLLDGYFFYSGLSEFRLNGVNGEHIAGVDLVYMPSNRNEPMVPYYCFYVVCPDEQFGEKADQELIKDLEFYQDFYVPAVETKYGENCGFDIPPFNGVIPCVYMNGNLYYWDTVVTRANVPKGFTEWGELCVTSNMPSENGQIMGFEMEGVLYSDNNSSEVVYVWIESELMTEWEGGNYVRFTTEYIEHKGKGEIYLYENRYSCVENVNYIAAVDALPAGYESVGTLVYIGADYLPSAHLETNYYEASNRKREVYYSEDNPETIYVAIENSQKETVYRPAYLLEKDGQ